MRTPVRRRRAIWQPILYCLAIALTSPLATLAQNATGAINGIVKDQNDAVIAKAVVTATNKATGTSRNVNAGNDGIFAFESLMPGEYEVKVEAQGFTSQIQKLAVAVGTTTTANFSLNVGAVTQVV